MSAPVDVLAVMDHASLLVEERGLPRYGKTISEARASVAELMEAAEAVQRQADQGKRPLAARSRLRAALDLCGAK